MKSAALVSLLLLLAGICAAQDTTFDTGPQYLITFGSPMFARPIATPSLSFETPMAQPGVSEPVESPVSREEYEAVSAILDTQRQTYLLTVYYGVPSVNVIDISFRAGSSEESGPALPASITESGVTELTDADVLRERGYGVTLSEAAIFSKAHHPHAPRVYTNSDIERVRQGT
jgi:hypothetical protein